MSMNYFAPIGVGLSPDKLLQQIFDPLHIDADAKIRVSSNAAELRR